MTYWLLPGHPRQDGLQFGRPMARRVPGYAGSRSKAMHIRNPCVCQTATGHPQTASAYHTPQPIAGPMPFADSSTAGCTVAVRYGG